MLRKSRVLSAAALGAVGLTSLLAAPADAAVYNKGVTGSWNEPLNWTPNDVPDTAGENATFNGAQTDSNAAQTANRTINLDGSKTVGSILFNNDLGTFTTSIGAGSGGTLTLDSGTAGVPATITTQGGGTGNNTISAAMSLTSSLLAIVNQTSAGSQAGSLNLTGAIGGTGGFTKQGDGLATFGTAVKAYTGPTVLEGGRMRVSLAGRPTGTSSFTVKAGAQLTFLVAGGNFTFGADANVPLNLNGTGAVSGPFSAFPGAIRPETGTNTTIQNVTVLQSDTLIHVQALAGTGITGDPIKGQLTFANSISGPGKLTFTAPNSNFDQGFLRLNADNSYAGGTVVAGGVLELNGAAADLGTGDVTVSSATSPDSAARLSILAGVSNGINDAATLRIAGGGDVVILGDGVNEVVGRLELGGIEQAPGTYGSSNSPDYFSGTGVVTVVPEPGALSLLALGLTAMLRRRRREV